MFEKLRQYLGRYDWILFFSVVILLSLGLAEIYSIALGQNQLDLLNFKKQLFFVILGIGLLFIVSFINFNTLQSYSNYLYLAGIVILIAVFFFGTSVRGTKGWFGFGFFTLQPVEFIKFILILFLAKYFSSISIKLNPLKHLFLTGFFTLVLVSLILFQPDFGSSLLLLSIWGVMIIAAGFKKRYFLFLFLIMSIAFLIGWLFLFKDYQKERIMTFINPSFDPLEQGYNVKQAIIAVGSGGIIGRGIGFGSQSQLKFLPESQNDFIFAVIAEETGFVGVCVVLILFIIFFFRIFANISKIDNDFGIFYLIGLSGLIFIEMFINIGMNIGILPVVGISLPFLSYGGSAILAKLIMLGVAENIIVKAKKNA
jgi:rod shape determining protein RodA